MSVLLLFWLFRNYIKQKPELVMKRKVYSHDKPDKPVVDKQWDEEKFLTSQKRPNKKKEENVEFGKEEEPKKDKKVRFRPFPRRQLQELMCSVAHEMYPGYSFKEVRPDWLKNPKTGRNLELDCYCEKLKLNFEGHGIQHLQFDKNNKFLFNNEEEFKKQVERDVFKTKRCEQEKVYHLEIPFAEVVPQKATYEEARSALKRYMRRHTKELNDYFRAVNLIRKEFVQ